MAPSCSASSPSRQALLTLVFTLVLIVSGVFGAEGIDKQDAGEALKRKLNETLGTQPVRYTPVNSTAPLPYNSSTAFNPKGMRQLFNITNKFINLVIDRQAYPRGMVRLVEREPVFADPVDEWRPLALHYGGIAGIAVVGLVLAALLPIIGLFFCCCRCLGHCGARSEPFDKKHDHCRKVVLNATLIVTSTLILFGVVCAFVTNEYMHEGTRELPHAAKTSLRDVQLYLTSTRDQLDTLLKVNYQELEKTLNGILHASGRIVTEQLAESSHAISLMNLNDIVAGLDNIRKDLKHMNDLTKQLRNYASQLDIVIRRVRNSLLKTLTSCSTQECREAMHKYKINEMKVKVDFDKLPDSDVVHVLNNISQLLDDNIVDEVRRGKDQFLNIQKEIQHAVNQTIPVVSASIRRAGDSLAVIANNVTRLIDRINGQIDRDYVPKLDYARQHIDEYSPYRYYVGLGISCILLIILTCLVFGLLCGICGKRPDGYGDDCCDKGSGACSLMTAVWLIFLLTSALMIATVAHMLFGIAAERAVCEPLENPKDNHVFELVEQYVSVKRIIFPKTPEAELNMSHILSSCHRNESIYNVLKLWYIVDMDALRGYVDRYDINQTIHQLEQKISLSHDYKIISQSAREKLDSLAQSGLSDIKFWQYTDNLKENITSIDLENLGSKLRDLASRLPRGHESIREELLRNALELEVCHRDIVSPMSNLSNQLSDSAVELQEHIKFNHSSMTEAIHSLVDEVDKAQVFISKSGPAYVRMLAGEFGKAFIHQVNSYLEYVINSTVHNVGKCGPISNAYNATLVASCNKILDPFNGFWASVGWCLILFLPTIILCVKLSALYQKSDPYPGPLVDAIHDKKYGHGRYHHHHHHHPAVAYPESYEGPAIGYTDRERIVDPHQGSSHHDSRYADLAPKNWDFPNGGPPRYQPAAVAPPLSTEYERPPPYYYPGPGDRN